MGLVTRARMKGHDLEKVADGQPDKACAEGLDWGAVRRGKDGSGRRVCVGVCVGGWEDANSCSGVYEELGTAFRICKAEQILIQLAGGCRGVHRPAR